jgi:iron complex outermembrane recepter protein
MFNVSRFSKANALGSLSRPALVIALILTPSGAFAQDSDPLLEGTLDAGTEQPLIVVRGGSLRGQVVSDIPAELDLSEEDIASYGASSVEDLLETIAPQTGSARGRGSGSRPIILLNGQRISSFRELRDLPPEAIQRVQVFPEELAIRYGYRPDQRVVNFILKPNFASISGEVEHGLSTQGGYGASEIEATLTRIGESSRLNLDVEYQRSGSILESERDIVQSQIDSLGLVDNGDFRTLTGASETYEINAIYNRRFSDSLSATLSGEYTREDGVSQLGLPGVSLAVPASSPFARSGDDETIFRLLPAAGGTLERFSTTTNAEAGLTVNGLVGDYRWAFTSNYSRAVSETDTERASGLAGLQARVAAGDPAIDPFSSTLGAGLGFTRDRSRSLAQNADAEFNIAGSPFDLPAGAFNVSATTGVEWQSIDSRSVQSGVVSVADLSRKNGFGRISFDIPLTSRREGFLDAIGDLSLNANIGYSDLSDFGGLLEYGYGINWEPIEGLTFLASVIGEEAAPTVQQLGNPLIVTPNVSIFDFTNGTSVLVDRTTGGNPALLAEDRQDFKVGVNFAPGNSRNLRFVAEYINNNSDNVSATFPVLTPEIEAAFPDRVTRDGAGNLVSVDARPVNFAETHAERIRYGVNLSGEISRNEGERGEGRRGEGQRGEGGGAGRGGGRGPGGPGGGRPSRWQLSVYHTYSLEETVLIRPGVPELDLLGGSVTDSSSPVSRHSVEMEGGVFLGGIGMRVSAEYTGSARIDGNTMLSTDSLFFDDLFTMNARMFLNFDSQSALVEAVPFLGGARMSLRVDNLFGGIRRVTDQNGDVPLSYQPGYLDARGRYVELSFRKRF